MAFRYKRILVTYADDSKRHVQRILRMCQCLEMNGCSCCMDVYDRRLSTTDNVRMVKQRFNEADAIMIIVSEQYKLAVTEETVSNRQNATLINRLMMDEIHRIGRNQRFIPIIVEGAFEQDIPWLRWEKQFKWPSQFHDLMQHLTRLK